MGSLPHSPSARPVLCSRRCSKVVLPRCSPAMSAGMFSVRHKCFPRRDSRPPNRGMRVVSSILPFFVSLACGAMRQRRHIATLERPLADGDHRKVARRAILRCEPSMLAHIDFGLPRRLLCCGTLGAGAGPHSLAGTKQQPCRVILAAGAGPCRGGSRSSQARPSVIR